MLSKHLNKNNLHHAYLIEGLRDEVVPEVLKFIKSLDIETTGNPDFVHISIDNLKIGEALSLRSMSSDKSFSMNKKVFLLTINSFTLDAENVLLKMFEEPIDNTQFFLIVPDINALLKTLVSRFYVIKSNSELELKDAEKFMVMPLSARINFIKNLLVSPESEDEEGNEIAVQDSTRSKALNFLNALELTLHSKIVKNPAVLTLPGVPVGTYAVQNSLQSCLGHFFKVREFLRMPGSSTKSLIESVALVIPIFKN